MKTNLITAIALLALALSGCSRDPQRATHLSFHRISAQSSDVTRPANLNGETIYLIEPPAIMSPMIADAYSSIDDHGRPYIFIKFAAPTISDFAAVSRAAIGERLAIVVSGELVAAPVLREPISNGVISVSGPFSPTKAQDITSIILGLDRPNNGETNQVRK
jgi:preprotein translocase subunit SecD